MDRNSEEPDGRAASRGPVASGPAGGSGGGIAPTPAANQVQWFGGGWGRQWSDTWGYAGDDVPRVTVTLSNGMVVDATVTNGYFAAWSLSVSPNDEHGQAPYTLTRYLKGGALGGTHVGTADWPKNSQVPQLN